MEKMTLQKHGISYTKIQNRESLIKKWNGFPSTLAIAFSFKSWSVLEELGVWVKIHRTEVLPDESVLHPWNSICFIILTKSIRIKAKPLPISLDLFSTNM